MRYVIAEPSVDGGFWVDPRPYLDWLERHAEELPPGARAFAVHPEHYDFSHEWCPRGVTLARMSTRETDGVTSATVVLAGYLDSPAEFVMRYHDVSGLAVTRNADGSRRDLLVDEVIPHEGGVSHELVFADRTITVVAKDLSAGWSGKAGPESPRDPGPVDSSNPATLVRHLRLGRRMFVLDGTFATLAAFIDGHAWGVGLDIRPFSRWLTERLRASDRNVTWQYHIVRHVFGPDRPTASIRDLTGPGDEAACSLALDLLTEYLAEQGYVAD